MGRGRAKAKQTKVARDLKYNSGSMDLNRLRADLIHEDGSEVDPELLAKYEDLAAAASNGDSAAGDADDEDEDDLAGRTSASG
jgi:Protein of unknown function (DUF3073)